MTECPDCGSDPCICVATTIPEPMSMAELEAHLIELEENDPIVRRAAENYASMVQQIVDKTKQ